MNPEETVGVSKAETLDAARPDAAWRIGPYRVLRRLGQGGMAAVYLAARDDDQYQKRVAIKVIKAGLQGERVDRHFRRERQILAALDHPNIARLLDGGAMEDGSPYLVMEYIEGQQLHVYCDRASLSTRQRLQLFLGVCSAVAYAHRNLIVHRDLKPSNILVTVDGVPRLLDFGIAKLLNPDLSGDPASATAVAMTPQYASPEQVRGDTITTASDVYSLGVVLYELLTGHRPYRFKASDPLEVLRAVCEAEPERPSAAVGRTEEVTGGSEKTTLTPEVVSRTREGTPEKLRRRLQGDLDTIVLKALRKEPPRRYRSVDAFAGDVQRYLEGRPITARKATPAYRAAKFVRRHAVGVAATTAIAVLLIASGVNMAVQSGRLQRERDKAERVSGFLVDLFKVSEPSEAKGNKVTARELLDRGVQKIQGELRDQPELRASLLDTMGRVHSSLGLYNAAHPLLREALEVRRAELGPAHVDLARSLDALAILLGHKADYAGAQALHREALAMRRKLLGPEHLDIAMSLNNLARVFLQTGEYDEGESLQQEALAMRRNLLGTEHPDVAKSINNLATFKFMRGDPAGAEPLFREALAMNRRLLGPEHLDLAVGLHNVAAAAGARRDWEASEAMYREALALRRKHQGSEHPDIAANLFELATVLDDKGDYDRAEALYRESQAMYRKFVGNSHPKVAVSLIKLGTLLTARGDARGAEPVLREGLEMARQTMPENPSVAEAESALGGSLSAQGRFEEAEPLLAGSLPVLRSKRGDHHRATREALQRLVRHYEAWGRREQTEEHRALLAAAMASTPPR